jgi:hypothetical protein
VPVIKSVLTRLVGAAPDGTVTLGSVASGPLVGVVIAGVVLVEVEVEVEVEVAE